MAFKDYETEIPLNELLRNFENHRVKWLDSRDISKKEKKELSASLDLIYLELQNQTLSERNEVRNFITNIEDTPANRRALGFLSGLLDSRPKQSKTEPEEVKLPKYSNNHLKYDFANRGWANGNEVDLGTWEAKDYNDNSFTGITNRVSLMKDFLTSYRDNLKDEYDYSGSRYGNKENLLERLDTAINILSNETLTGETALDQITQALGALGWSSEEVKLLFRTSIPQPATTSVDPLAERAAAVERAQLEMRIEQAEQLINNYRNAQSSEDDFANYWLEKFVIPFTGLPIQTAIYSNINPASIQIPQDKNWNEEGLRLYNTLKNGELINQNDIQSLASLYEYYSKHPNLVKKVNGTNEIYLDTFVIPNKGIYYTYDPITKVIYKRRIQDNEDLYDLIKASYKKPVERPGFTPINKEGGVLKLQFGNYIPLPEIPIQPASSPVENKNEKISTNNDTNVLDMTALGLDLTGLIASLFPGYGNLIGGVSGMAGSITSFAADWKRDGIQWKDGLLLGANLGSDLVGLIPGAGVIGKLAKVRKYGKPILTLLSLANAGVSTYNVASKILDPNVKFKDITMDEWNLFAQAVIPLIVLGKNKKAESNLENILEQAPSGKNRNQLLDDVINSDFSTSGQKSAALRAKWVSTESNVDKTKQLVDAIWNTDGTVKSKPKPEVTTPEVQTETPTAPKSNKVKTINEVPKKEVKIMRKLGYSDAEIIRLFNKGKKLDGGKINYLTSLREGGIIKADNGLKFQELEIPTQDNNASTFVPLLGTLLSFNLKPYDYYLNNPGIKTFTNFEYKPKTPFAIKTSDLFNSELNYKFPVKSSKVNALGTEYTPEIESTFKFKLPGIGAEITKALATISFNNRLAKKAKEAIKPVYKSDVPVIALSVKGDYEILDSYNRGIQNLYNQVATQTFNDPTLLKLTLLEAWSKQLDAGVLRDLAYAQSYKLSDAANLQTLQQAANQNYENDFYNDSVTASVAKAKSDIDSAKDYKNFTVGINSIDYLQKRNYDKANSYNQHALNAIQNLIYDKMYNELAGVTDVNELRMIYRKYLNMIQNKINEFYGIPTYDSFLFNYQIAKKGGKLDRNLQISKMLEKRYIELLKKDERKLDRLSKVTQKAILKSLGLK